MGDYSIQVPKMGGGISGLMGSTAGKLGMGYATGGASLVGGTAGKALGMYNLGKNAFGSSPKDPALSGSDSLQKPELGDSAGVGQQQYGLGGDGQKLQGGWDASSPAASTQSQYGLGTMQKRFSQNGGY